MFADRVKETSTTTGTGTIDLLGEATGGFITFVAGIGNGNVCYYCIVLTASNEWEVGIGTVTDAATDTLSRTTVLASSNSGALVNFSAGTKDAFCTIPANDVEVPQANNAPKKNITVVGGNSAIISEEYEIVDTYFLEIQNTSNFEIT